MLVWRNEDLVTHTFSTAPAIWDPIFTLNIKQNYMGLCELRACYRGSTHSLGNKVNDVYLQTNFESVIYCRFHRGQPVFVEYRETGKVSAVISAIGTQEVNIPMSWDSAITDGQMNIAEWNAYIKCYLGTFIINLNMQCIEHSIFITSDIATD